MTRVTSLTIGLAIISCLIAPLSTHAVDTWFQNDGYPGFGQVYYQAGFVANEICASRFVPAPTDYPILLKKVSVMVQDGGGGGQTGSFTLKIWEDNGTMQPGPLLFEMPVMLTAQQALNEIDISGAGLVINSGGIRVGYQFGQNPPPSFVRDADGNIQSQRNLIYAIPGGWFWSELLGLQGDWVLRLMGDTNYSPPNTPTPAPTEPYYSPTPFVTSTPGLYTPTPGPTSPPATPTPTATTPPFTATPTNTPGPETPSSTPTHTHTPTSTPTPVNTGTAMPTEPPSNLSISWDSDTYIGLDAHGAITVVDPDRNTNPGTTEQTNIKVWSASDPYPGGITVAAFENGPSSDTFSTVFPHVSFSTSSSSEPDDVLLVSDGETIYARYITAGSGEELIASAQWRLRQGITLDLEMPSHSFSQGDTCWLNLDFVNSGETVDADLYVLLEVFGQFYCYPAWMPITSGVDHDDMYVPAAFNDTIEIIPAFTMPQAGQAGPLYFYAAMFEDGFLTPETLMTNVATWEFSLE